MDIIDRYIYEVVSKLPEKGKEDIGNEIKSIIYDMMDNYGEDLKEEEKAYRALKELGDPEILAENYRSKKRYLIGPKYFNNYVYILKIVLGAVFLAVTVSSIIGAGIAVKDVNPGRFITKYMNSLVSGLAQAAFWVTVTFGIIEYNSDNEVEHKKEKRTWEPSMLPKIPNDKIKIEASECIIGIIVTTIFFAVFYFSPQYISMYRTQGAEKIVIPLFNLETLSNFNILIVAIFILGISKGLLKLILGKWTLKFSIIYSILSIVSAGLIIVLLSNQNIFNPDFMTYISENIDITNKIRLITPKWVNLARVILVTIVISTIIDIKEGFFKAIKYERSLGTFK